MRSKHPWPCDKGGRIEWQKEPGLLMTRWSCQSSPADLWAYFTCKRNKPLCALILFKTGLFPSLYYQQSTEIPNWYILPVNSFLVNPKRNFASWAFRYLPQESCVQSPLSLDQPHIPGGSLRTRNSCWGKAHSFLFTQLCQRASFQHFSLRFWRTCWNDSIFINPLPVVMAEITAWSFSTCFTSASPPILTFPAPTPHNALRNWYETTRGFWPPDWVL